MDPQEYLTMFKLEDNHWWYNGLRNIVFSFLEREKGEMSGPRILDAGCGTGGILDAIKNKYNMDGIGFDISREALSLCSVRGLLKLIQASANEMPFYNEQFDVIISLDLLYHLAIVDDLHVIQNFNRVLCPGGILLLNLPAYEKLKSSHDIAIHTRHRYTRKELKNKLVIANFEIIKISYRNTLLFPLVAFVRLIKKWGALKQNQKNSDLKYSPLFLNKFLSYIFYFENWLLKYLHFPFGLSIFCVARKNSR